MKTIFVSMCGAILLLSSCSPRISSSISKNYPTLLSTEEVKVYELKDKAPEHAELLGEVNIGDTGFSTKCDYATVIEAARQEVRKAGGNALKITQHLFPDFASSCHRIKASIYKVSSINELSVTQMKKDSILPKQTSVAEIDTIQISGHKYTYNGQILTMNSMEELLQYNPKAMEYFNKAKGTAGFTNILAYAGGFLIGWPIGTALGGGQPNWTMALIGCGIVAIALPIASGANTNFKKAVETYNMGLMPSPKTQKYDFRMGMNQNGLALVIRF